MSLSPVFSPENLGTNIQTFWEQSDYGHTNSWIPRMHLSCTQVWALWEMYESVSSQEKQRPPYVFHAERNLMKETTPALGP